MLVSVPFDEIMRASATDRASDVGRPVDAGTAARLRRLARALARTTDEAEELAQDAAARLLDRAPDKVGHAGYERQTITRLWLDRQRSVARRVRRLARAAWRGDAAPDAESPAETNAVVRTAMDGLPDRQRAVLVLIVVEGLTHAEAAASLGCSESASRQALAAARKSLRAKLEGRV
ncbi:MAG: sigma-70 family RNA polymerase sigma factor [Planctomycetota bacterium]